MRIMASLTKAATVREYRSKSRAKRRLRLIHARVRSTIQRLGNIVSTHVCRFNRQFGRALPASLGHRLGSLADNRCFHVFHSGQPAVRLAQANRWRLGTEARQSPPLAAF
jgi:hypothetical protein